MTQEEFEYKQFIGFWFGVGLLIAGLYHLFR